MNQITTRPETSMNSVGIATGTGGASIAPQNLGEVVRFAEVMCRADIALPKHLRGNAGACMAVALQALEWAMSPFAVASKSYSVNGQIAYEAQLIAAVVNTRSGIKGRLKYHYEGEGNDLVCRVTGILDGVECEYETPPLGSITPKNSPLWKTDPKQQLGYYAARSWARRHCPEVILGVYDRDEAEQFRGPDNAKDVTPSISDRLALARQEATDTREGFDADFVTRETETLTSATDVEQEPSSVPSPNPADDAGSGEPSPSLSAPDNTADEADHAEPEAGDTSTPVSGSTDLATINLMEECRDKMLGIATDENVPDPAQRRGVLEKTKDVWKNELDNQLPFVKACFEAADRIIKSNSPADEECDYLTKLIDRVRQ